MEHDCDCDGPRIKTKKIQPTELPWIVDDNPRNVGIRSEKHGRLASLSETTLGQDLANAAYIVRAVNTYQPMLEALKSIAANSCCAPCREAGLVAKQAIVRAEGK